MTTSETSSPLKDAPEREYALNPAQSFIVQAPAGSGKTELLTRRVLILLATVNEPEEVLALTFTRKAAAEMRQRVIAALRRAHSDVPPSNDYEAAGMALARTVLARDEALQWSLLDNPQRLRMSTIDSLCTELAQRLPLTSTLGGAARPVDDAQALYLQAARRLIENRFDKLDRVILQTGNRLEVAMRLWANMLSFRDQWMRNIDLRSDPEALRATLQEMLRVLVQKHLEDAQSLLDGVLGSTAQAELWQLLQRSAIVQQTLHEADPTYGVSEFADTLAEVECPPEANSEKLGAWAAFAHAVLVKNSESIRKKLDRRSGFPVAKKDALVLDQTEADLRTCATRMVELLNQMNESDALVTALNRLRVLPFPRYSDDEWDLLRQLIQALPYLVLELHSVFSETQTIDFVEMSSRASTALGTELNPTDLALALDLRIQHVLVDEFQDTSQTQFQLFEKLLYGWTEGDGKSIFIVGDPMQSIYRFRNADVGLFQQVQRLGIADIRPVPLKLSVNFRSSPDVVSWVNTHFKDLFDDEVAAVADPAAIVYAESFAFQSNSGSVNPHLVIAKDRHAEAQLVASLAAAALGDSGKEGEEVPAGSIAILVRSRTQAKPIFHALRALGVAYQSVEMDSLGEQPVVRDLMSLCMALRYPQDRLHWLALLRAPWCGLSLIDLHKLMRDSGHTPVFELLAQKTRLERLSLRGQRKIAWLYQVLRPAVARAPRSTLVPWIEAVWLQLGGPALCRTTLDLDAAERCLQRMQELELEGRLWQFSVLQSAMLKLFAESSEAAAVQVMTMHRSKGLEFETVILPALDSTAGQEEARLLEWSEQSVDGRTQLLLAPFSERKASGDARLLNRFVKSLRVSGDDKEKRRLLYVACTRARTNLHLTATLKESASGDLTNPPRQSLLNLLWPVLQESFIEHQYTDEEILGDSLSDSQADSGESAPPLRRLGEDWELPMLSGYCNDSTPIEAATDRETGNEPIEFLWAGSKARHIGTVLHGQLQEFSQSALPDLAHVTNAVQQKTSIIRNHLLHLGLSEQDIEAATSTAKRALCTCLTDECGRWILSEHAEAKSEWALSATEGETLTRIIIDRTFVDDKGLRWIIDYKTGDHKGGNIDTFLDREQERYFEQLNRYASIVSRIDLRPIKLGLYFPLLGAFRSFDVASPMAAHSAGAMQTSMNFD